MTKVSWADLASIYAITNFADDGTGRLTISTQPVLETLLLLDRDDDASEDAGMAVLSESSELELGRSVQLQFNPPRTSLGRFVPTFGTLIAGPKARVEEPANYFVVEGRVTERTAPSTDYQVRYRAALRLVALLKQAAAYLDAIQQDLVFFRDGRMHVPIDYDVGDLESLALDDVDRLLGQFDDQVHQEQKLSILSEAVIDVIAGLPLRQRFRHIMQEAGDIAERVASGYRLFASSFTYSKIRREVESAQAEFLARIHKTFVDIQGQVLGIPIATVVVATQLKPIAKCGVEVWTNIAVVAGAWIFVVFLLASLINQSMTLDAIVSEFKRQQHRLLSDFAVVSSSFNDAFVALERRSLLHRCMLVIIAAIGIAGATFATKVAGMLISVDIGTCY